MSDRTPGIYIYFNDGSLEKFTKSFYGDVEIGYEIDARISDWLQVKVDGVPVFVAPRDSIRYVELVNE